MRIINGIIFILLVGIIFLMGCSHSFILLSPEDLYALGNYYMEESKYRNAGDQFEQIRNHYPTSRFATMSQFKLALTEYEKRNYADAAVEFKLFLEFHPAHKMAPQAQYYIALSKFNSIPSPERDISMAIEAKTELTAFLKRYPDHPDLEKVNQYLSDVIDHLQTHEIEVAKVYYRRRSYNATLLRLSPVLDTKASPYIKQTALLLIARTHEKMNAEDEAREYYQKVIDNGDDEKLTHIARNQLQSL
ncbi:outer membrane protein assembly factor BamD [bacterium]|nr:outer membrane protein assembly factor BamD [bacterium]